MSDNKTQHEIAAQIRNLYDEVAEFNNFCFFFGDAIPAVLSLGYELESETISGIHRMATELKLRSRKIKEQLKSIHESTGKK